MAAWRSLSVSRYPVAALRVVWLYSSTAFIAQRRHQCTTSSHSTTHHCLARSADSAALSTPHSARLHTSHACHASPLISRRMPHAASLSLSQPLLLEIHLREASVASRLQILPFFLCRGETRHQLLHACLQLIVVCHRRLSRCGWFSLRGCCLLPPSCRRASHLRVHGDFLSRRG